MNGAIEEEIAGLLERWRCGDRAARDRLVSQLYPWLEAMAGRLLLAEKHISLGAGDLVHEAMVRLLNAQHVAWADGAHFKAVSAQIMRRVLIDRARARNAARREHYKVTLVTGIAECPSEDLVDLDSALDRLATIDPERAEIVEMRYFGGMSLPDVALVTGLSEATVKRRWASARTWLAEALA